MSVLSGDDGLDPLEMLWYRHIAYCQECAAEESRCLIGECIFQELVKRLNKLAEL
jgi:hypothetical protein